MKKFLLLTLILISVNVFSEEDKAPNTIYKYKEYEKFDFDDLNVEGDSGAAGEVSVNPRFMKEFKNKLPEKHNFNSEMLRALDSIK